MVTPIIKKREPRNHNLPPTTHKLSAPPTGMEGTRFRNAAKGEGIPRLWTSAAIKCVAVVGGCVPRCERDCFLFGSFHELWFGPLFDIYNFLHSCCRSMVLHKLSWCSFTPIQYWANMLCSLLLLQESAVEEKILCYHKKICPRYGPLLPVDEYGNRL